MSCWPSRHPSANGGAVLPAKLADLLQRVGSLPALALELAVEVRNHRGDWRVPGEDRRGLLWDSCGALALCVGAHQRAAAVPVLLLVSVQSGDQPVHQIR